MWIQISECASIPKNLVYSGILFLSWIETGGDGFISSLPPQRHSADEIWDRCDNTAALNADNSFFRS